MSESLIEDLVRRAGRKFWKPILTGVTILSVIFGIGVFQTLQYIDDEIRDRFAEPRVADTLERVASDRASQIIQDSVNPAIEEAREFIDAETQNLRSYADAIRGEFSAELAELRAETEFQKELRSIQQLEDQAIFGSLKAYRALETYSSESPQLWSRARGSVSFVKGLYVGKERVSPEPLQLTRDDGLVVEENDLLPQDLFVILKDDKAPFVRARAAKILARHRVKGVPEALLQAAISDSSLWVRVVSLSSFEKLTRYTRQDVFGFDDAVQWYQENRERLAGRFEDLPHVGSPQDE